MVFGEAVPGFCANVVEEVVGVLAGGIRADEHLAAIVKEGGLIAFSHIAIIVSSERLSPSLAKAASSITTR
jgi:hypothetical protein